MYQTIETKGVDQRVEIVYITVVIETQFLYISLKNRVALVEQASSLLTGWKPVPRTFSGKK